MPDVAVVISADALCAYLWVSPARSSSYPSFAELADCLRDHGVTYGIDESRLRQMTAVRICNSREIVARGTASVPGVPGQLEYLIDISQRGTPRLREDGGVDHRDVQLIFNVEKGRPLVRRIPPQPGTEGRTVSGKPIKPAPVSDVVLPIGRGTALCAHDGNLLVSANEGGMVIGEDGTFNILTQKVISGDVDYSTGNVDFCGELRIEGSVRSGFMVKALGTTVIAGNVEEAQVVCEADLHIRGGAAGSGKGCVRAKGDLTVKHIERFVAEAGKNLTVTEDAMHSTLSAGGCIVAKTIVGGTACAGSCIEAMAAGNEAQIRTVLQIGGVFALTQERTALLENLARLSQDMATLGERIFLYVKEGMNCDGVLSADAEAKLSQLRQQRSRKIYSVQEARRRAEEIERHIASFPPAWIKVRKLYPGTVIKFGSYERLISRELTDTRLTMDGDRLVTTKTRSQ